MDSSKAISTTDMQLNEQVNKFTMDETANIQVFILRFFHVILSHCFTIFFLLHSYQISTPIPC